MTRTICDRCCLTPSYSKELPGWICRNCIRKQVIDAEAATSQRLLAAAEARCKELDEEAAHLSRCGRTDLLGRVAAEQRADALAALVREALEHGYIGASFNARAKALLEQEHRPAPESPN